MHHMIKWLPGPVLVTASTGNVCGFWFYLNIHYRTSHWALGIIGGIPYVKQFARCPLRKFA